MNPDSNTGIRGMALGWSRRALLYYVLWIFTSVTFLPLANASMGWRSQAPYEVFSTNKRFVAEVKFNLHARDFKVTVREIINGDRVFRWELQQATTRGERIFLANNGQHLVLEKYSDIIRNALSFYHLGREVRAYRPSEVMPPPPEINGRVPYLDDVMIGPSWGRKPKFNFLGTAGGEDCYCAWFVGQTNWMAWRLKDGERIIPNAEQEQTWNKEAAGIATRIIDGEPAFAASTIFSPFSDGSVSLQLLAHLKKPGIQARMEAMLNSRDYSMAGHGPDLDLVRLSAYSPTRAMGERQLAQLDPLPSSDSRRGEQIRQRRFLGSAQGVIELREVPKGGVIVIALAPASAGPGWPASLPVERITARFTELHESMRRIMNINGFKPSARLSFSFGDLLPGEYRVKALWQPGVEVEPAGEKITPGKNDWLGESEIATVSAGLTADLGLFRCDQPAVR